MQNLVTLGLMAMYREISKIFPIQEGHDGPVSLHWLIHEIPSYQALQYLGIGLKHRPLTRTKIGSHSSYVKHQGYFKRLHHMKPCKTCNPWQSIRPRVIINTFS